MSRFRRFEIVERSPSFFLKETSILSPPRTLMLNPCFPSFPIVEHELDCALDLLNFSPAAPFLLDDFDTVTDLIQIEETPFHTSTRRLTRRAGLGELYLRTLSDRVSALELGLEQLVREEKCRKKKIGERKYTWTAEIKSPEKDKKYKWVAEIRDGKDEKKGLEKSYKWTAEVKRKGDLPIEQTYTIKVSSGDGKSESEGEKKKKEKCVKVKGEGKSRGATPRIVEIAEPTDHGAVVLRQVGMH